MYCLAYLLDLLSLGCRYYLAFFFFFLGSCVGIDVWLYAGFRCNVQQNVESSCHFHQHQIKQKGLFHAQNTCHACGGDRTPCLTSSLVSLSFQLLWCWCRSSRTTSYFSSWQCLSALTSPYSARGRSLILSIVKPTLGLQWYINQLTACLTEA